MKKPNSYPQKHLTLSDRIYIEQELMQGSSFKSIADFLHKDPTTISKEVRLHAKSVVLSYNVFSCKYSCSRFPECTVCKTDPGVLCKRQKSLSCHCRLCRSCFYMNTSVCEYASPFKCERPVRPPYVCNSCERLKHCPIPHKVYSASLAQKQYEKTLADSRKGINMTPEELTQINDLISPLILKGQPLSHIFAVHADEIPVCRRTLYNYLDQRVFQARNIDLPRRVRYKKRRRSTTSTRSREFLQTYRNKRTFKDFEYYLQMHPDTDVVEMDTVKGRRSTGKCLLTLLFRSCSFMIVILLNRCTQEEVVRAINVLTDTIGIRLFRKYFPVLLADNGSEFKDPWSIEKTPDGKHRTFVYYCDPYISNQKARLEKNHEYIRYIIPKGKSMSCYTQKDITLMASHINSTARDGLNGQTPYDLAQLLLDKKIPSSLGITRINADEVLLKPSLLEHPRHRTDQH